MDQVRREERIVRSGRARRLKTDFLTGGDEQRVGAGADGASVVAVTSSRGARRRASDRIEAQLRLLNGRPAADPRPLEDGDNQLGSANSGQTRFVQL